MKVLLVILLAAILAALTGAGLLMLRRGHDDEGDGKPMARALALRVGLSIALFLLILLAWWQGWIQPSGIPVGR